METGRAPASSHVLPRRRSVVLPQSRLLPAEYALYISNCCIVYTAVYVSAAGRLSAYACCSPAAVSYMFITLG